MAMDLKQDVFQSVVTRVRERGDSLRSIAHCSNTGIEGWFKVEIVAALGEKTKVNNKGPDLTLEDGTNVEIKAATDFSKSWCITKPLQKYVKPVLFLAGKASPEKLAKFKDDSFEIVAYEVVSDGANDWLLGMVKPSVRRVSV